MSLRKPRNTEVVANLHITDAEQKGIRHRIVDLSGMDVAGRGIELEIDTGVTVTAFSTSTYQKYLKHIQLRPSTTRLYAYNGQPLNVQGEEGVPVRYKGQQVNVKFHVIKVKSKPAILGRDWLKHFKLDWDSIFTVQKF